MKREMGSCYSRTESVSAPEGRKLAMPPRRSPTASSLLAGVAVLALMGGCGEEDKPPGSAGAESAPESPAAAPEAGDAAPAISLEVTADKTHAVQPGDEIGITVSVEGFTLDAAGIGSEAEPGRGHYHVYFGGSEGEPLLVSADANAVVKVSDDVTDGTHSLLIQLRGNDHSPLDPPIETKVRLIIYRL